MLADALFEGGGSYLETPRWHLQVWAARDGGGDASLHLFPGTEEEHDGIGVVAVRAPGAAGFAMRPLPRMQSRSMRGVTSVPSRGGALSYRHFGGSDRAELLGTLRSVAEDFATAPHGVLHAATDAGGGGERECVVRFHAPGEAAADAPEEAAADTDV
jgi:hypothetical protein